MFQGLFRRAENTIDSVVSRFVSRALVAFPLIVASGFATAAITVKLIEIYGAVVACSLMAALFALVGLVTMAVVDFGARTDSAESPAAETAAAASSSDGAEVEMDPTDLLTPEIKAFLASAAPMALPGLARGVTRNLPLILILALIGFVISRFATSEATTAGMEGTMAGDRAAEVPPAAAA
jgi:hypothetical protein